MPSLYRRSTATSRDLSKPYQPEKVAMTELTKPDLPIAQSQATDTETSIASPPFRLMNLPFELRAKVLAHTSTQKAVDVLCPTNRLSADSIARSPILLRAATGVENKQLRLECLLAVRKSTTIIVIGRCRHVILRDWLRSIDFASIDTKLEDGLEAVQSLDLPDFSRFLYWESSVHPSVELARQCKNVRTFKLTFTTQEVGTGMDPVTYEKVTTRMEDIAARYHLGGLLRLRELRSLRIHVSDSYQDNIGLEIAERAGKSITEWFPKCFEKRGMTVDVSVV